MRIKPPQLPALLYETTTLFTDEVCLESCKITNADLTGRTALAVSLEEVCLQKVNLSEAKLDKLSGRDILLSDSDLSAAHCPELSLQRMAAANNRMTGIDASQGTFTDVTFKNCKLDMANFRFSKLGRVKFTGCILTEADFLGAELHDVTFEGCLLERAVFRQAKLQNVDLRTSQLTGLQGWRDLKGATIDSEQLMAAAPYLAQEIGIKVC